MLCIQQVDREVLMITKEVEEMEKDFEQNINIKDPDTELVDLDSNLTEKSADSPTISITNANGLSLFCTTMYC